MAVTETPPSSAELRTKLVELGAKSKELRELPDKDRGDTYAADVTNTTRSIVALDAELKAVEHAERAAMDQYAWDMAVEAQKRNGPGPIGATAPVGGREARTLGEALELDEGYRQWQEAGARDFSSTGFRFELGNEIRTLITSSTSDTPAAGVLIATRPPIPPIPRQRRLFIRDLLSVGMTNLPAVPYVKELNPATNETGATAVQEGAAKPEIVMSFSTVTAVVRKLAAWVPATEEILADAPTLRSYIDARLVYMLKVREETDLLYGSDAFANPTIPGILGSSSQVTGVQTESVQQSNSTDDVPKTIGLGISKIELVDGSPDGIAMHPTDYWTMQVTRWGSAGGQHDAADPFNGPPNTLWGLPVVRTRSLTVKTAVVADWAGGGQIFDREGITLRTSDSHDTYFIYNKIAILVEERLAVAWYRPDFFCNCTVAS